MTYFTQMPKPVRYIIKPKPPYSVYQKHLGYFCKKCQSERRLHETRLCDCLVLEEDPKVIKVHINTFWSPIYADVHV